MFGRYTTGPGGLQFTIHQPRRQGFLVVSRPCQPHRLLMDKNGLGGISEFNACFFAILEDIQINCLLNIHK